jgi:CopG family transcriptional regulator/antitoxin EndoAI
MSKQRKIINISVPATMERQIQRLAREENKTKSELLREAFRVYQFRKDWARIRAWGEEIALKMGIESYDDVERIAG